MTKQLKTMNCKNCNKKVDGKFCSNCGQSIKVEQINFTNFLQDLSESIFQIDKGFFFTLKNLFTQPGQSLRDYLEGKRKNYFKPITYALLLSTFYFLISKVVGTPTLISDFLEGFSLADETSKTAINEVKVITWFANNYAYTILMLLPMYSLASFITFKKSNYNYLEHFIINAYIVGQQAIFYSIVAILNLWIKNEDFTAFTALTLSILYAFWVFWQLFPAYYRFIFIIRFLLMYILYLVTIIGILLVIFVFTKLIYG